MAKDNIIRSGDLMSERPCSGIILYLAAVIYGMVHNPVMYIPYYLNTKRSWGLGVDVHHVIDGTIT